MSFCYCSRAQYIFIYSTHDFYYTSKDEIIIEILNKLNGTKRETEIESKKSTQNEKKKIA